MIFRRERARQDLFADPGQCQVGLAGNDVVGELDNWLALGFVADFGAAETMMMLWAYPLQVADQPRRLLDVPDIHTQLHDTWILGQQRFQDVDRPLTDFELDDGGSLLQGPQVGQQIPQAERNERTWRSMSSGRCRA